MNKKNRLTVQEAAGELDCSDQAIRSAIANGQLPGYKVVGKWMIKRDEFEDWFDRCLGRPAQDPRLMKNIHPKVQERFNLKVAK